MHRHQSGFTLIELVMVIVILGILAAAALPKFADLTTDAERAATEGARGAVQAANAIGHSQALVDRATGATATITIEGVSASFVHGYPAASSMAALAGLSATDFTLTVAAAATPPTLTVGKGACSFVYTEAGGAATPPSVGAVTGC